MASIEDRFATLGFPGRDTRRVGVYVHPAVEVVNGKLVETHKIHIGNSSGDCSTDYPTDYIYGSMTDPWVFESFTLNGRTWAGIAYVPDSGDFVVRFGTEDQKSVMVEDTPKHFYTHRYQIVMRNTQTGEIVTTDPGNNNGDGEPSVP